MSTTKVIEFRDPVWSLLGDDYFQPVESLEAGRSYEPDWRWRKVQAYLRAYRNCLNPGEKAQSIQNERDQLIIDTFVDIAYRDRTNPGIYWSLDTVNSNRRRSGSSQIKAMLLGGGDYESIAREMSTTPECLDVYCRLFFDVGRYLDKPAYISSLFAPFQTMSSVDEASPASAEEAKERMWMMVGYNMGVDRVKAVMYRSTNVSPKDLQEFASSLGIMMGMAKFDYVATMRTYGNARPADFEKSLQYDQTQTQAMIAKQGQQGGNLAEFYARLLNIGNAELPKLPNNKGTSRVMALRSCNPVALEQAFGPEVGRPPLNSGVIDFLSPTRQIARTAFA